MWNRKKKARHPNEKTDKRNTRPDNSDVQATSKRRSPEGGADSVINSISEEISQKSHKADKNMDTTLQESTSTRGKPKSQKASSATSVPQLPMEIVEIIIDNVEDGATFLACSLVCREWLARCRYYFFSRISTSAASCSDLLPILNSSKYAPRPPSPSHSKTRDGGTDRPTLPPAGIFVQSLVITPSSDHILSPSSSSDPRYNPALAAKLLLECIPNVKELQLTSVSGWTIAHFLDPLTRMGKLEGVTLLDVRVSGWNKIMGSLAHCASTLKSLHVSGKIFSAFSSEDGDDNAKVSLPPADLCFPSLKRLSIDMERVYSDYAEDLICILTRGCTEALDHLEVLELPLWIVQSSHEFIQRVGRNLISLTVHCERSQGGNSEWRPLACLPSVKLTISLLSILQKHPLSI